MKLMIEIDGQSPKVIDILSHDWNAVQLAVSAWDLVSATIIGSDLPEGNLSLYVGTEPDIRATGSRTKNGVVFRYFANSEWRGQFRLFQGVLGQSLMILACESEDCEVRILAQIPVYVENDKQAVKYDAMVRDLLSGRRPHFICDNFLWTMRRNHFSLSWCEGYASYNDPEVELRATMRFLNQLQRPLRGVFAHPIVGLAKRVGQVRIARLQQVNLKVRRLIVRKMLRTGCEDVGDLSDLHVQASRLTLTYRHKSHRVIFGMLELLSGRIAVIREKIQDRLLDAVADRDTNILHLVEHTDAAKRKKDNMKAGANERIAGLMRLMKMSDSALNKIQQWKAHHLFAENRDSLTVFDVDESAFNATLSYLRVYQLILGFCRTRFWWVSDNTVSKYRIPKLSVSNDGESRLQKKYSVVYENWCYAKLIDSFMELGLDFVQGQEQRNRQGSYCEFKIGLSVIRIQHGGLLIKKKGIKASDMFRLRAPYKNNATPDIFLFIEDFGAMRQKCIVIDAKSDSVVREHMIKTRCDYACIERRMAIGREEWQPIDQSWLFYSGEDVEEGNACIEVPPTPVTSKRAGDRAEEEVDDHSSDQYSWIGNKGFSGFPDPSDPVYHGHVRVNVLSVATRDVILDFVRGQVSMLTR